MGFMKEAKADSMRQPAARAMEEGRRVLVVRIQTRFWSAGAFSGPMDDTAEMIEAIEDQGWLLDQMSYVMKKNDKPEGIYLFRRPAQRAPQPDRMLSAQRAPQPDTMLGREPRRAGDSPRPAVPSYYR
jgi:hypothetical protein